LVLLGQSPSPERSSAATFKAANPSFNKDVQPFLAKNCYLCHNEKLATANLNLSAFTSDDLAERKPDVWDKVEERLIAGKMPPAGRPVPSKAEVAPVLAWIDGVLSRAGFTRQGDPGRVMTHRLNRVEYNNTIRDLLGVAVRPADEFPVDDSGYGFDNNGDVLSVSPLLMEKYMEAAKTVSRLAVFGEALPPKPTRLVRFLNRRSPDADDVLSSGNAGIWLPYSLRGAMYGNWVAPVDAEYEFRLRIANFRGDSGDLTDEQKAQLAEERRKRFEQAKKQRLAGGASGRPREVTPEQLRAQEEAARKAAPPRKLILAVDGNPVITDVIEGTSAYGYSRGELVARAPVKAGEHFLRASFPELADLKDPRENINPDMRRGLFVDYLDIAGPYNPSTAPPESYKKIFVCGHPPGKHNAQCARQVLGTLMERAYRRPVTEEELGSKLSLVALAQREGDSLEEGVRIALEAILASPDFLFHLEVDPKPRSGTAGARQVSDYELASRLSYFLWGSMPDTELFRAAKERKLHQPDILETQVRRMLADPKSHNLVDNWAAQWLQLRNLGRTKPDPKRFPTVDDELLDAMRTETSMFVEAIISEDRSILDFIDAPFTFVNGPLARHYGIPGVNGEQFQRVTLDGEQRGGVLTQGAILTVSSYPTRTSPPVRGKWVLENLLGTPPPPPPPNVPSLNEANIGTEVSLRERLAQHRQDPSCSPCHNVMDPIGFGLENYDAVGAWRINDGKFPIEAGGTLPGGKTFNGSKGLKEILKGQSDLFVHNVTEKMLTYSLGRGLESYDRDAVDSICREVASKEYRFSALVLAVVNSKPFQMRSPEVIKP
jgi:Protein of unknown function (DUF1592)/Protein of unknown function (DUF1588)/Protein of unknown function (DUF1587)/Protein of unknown function (DUF1585)/Protein of unknown function (DUF1595)